jgi:hypothetical protein
MAVEEPKKPESRTAHIACAVLALFVLIVLSAAMLAGAMTKGVGRDEQMYCTAGVLLAQGKLIYRDFAYPSQLPYHPLLLAGLFRILGTRHFLLTGRLVSATCDILVMLSIVGIFRSLFRAHRRAGLFLGLAAAVLYAFNPLVEYAAGYAWNHDVVILCVVSSLWLFITTDFEKKSRYGRAALMGALLTFATCMRITTALVEIAFLLALLFASGGSWRERSRTALPFSAASFLVLAWPVWVIAQAPRVFWMNLTHIPALYGRWLQEVGMTHSKVTLTVAALATPGYLVLLALAGYLGWVLCRRFTSLDQPVRPKVLLTVSLPLMFFVIAFIPPTMWRQYLAVPVPFIVVALAYPLVLLRRHADTRAAKRAFTVASCSVGVGAILAVLSHPVVLYRTPLVLVPEQWRPVHLHDVSVEIARNVKAPRLICTLGPLQALEGGCEIYPELACGSIVYRVAELLSDEQRAVTHAVGPESLNALVASRRPAAVLVGVEPPYFSFLEDPLRRLAGPSWERETYEDGLQVYFRR